jgi:hypothetical protein
LTNREGIINRLPEGDEGHEATTGNMQLRFLIPAISFLEERTSDHLITGLRFFLCKRPLPRKSDTKVPLLRTEMDRREKDVLICCGSTLV